jgi:hypothetical protein
MKQTVLKKGELSLSVVVMAIIALVILLVLTFIVLRGSGNFSSGVNACGGTEVCAYDSGSCRSLVGDDFIAVPKSCEGPIDGGVGSKGRFCCRPIN